MIRNLIFVVAIHSNFGTIRGNGLGAVHFYRQRFKMQKQFAN
jgi:hypothetical protein